jgi:hypothetical protein
VGGKFAFLVHPRRAGSEKPALIRRHPDGVAIFADPRRRAGIVKSMRHPFPPSKAMMGKHSIHEGQGGELADFSVRAWSRKAPAFALTREMA